MYFRNDIVEVASPCLPCQVFFSLGGRHVNIPSNSTTWQLRAVAEALQNLRQSSGSNVFISADLALPDLGYEKSVKALQRMLELLEISHFDLVLVGAGNLENSSYLRLD